MCVCEGGRDLLQTKKDGDEKAEKKGQNENKGRVKLFEPPPKKIGPDGYNETIIIKRLQRRGGETIWTSIRG